MKNNIHEYRMKSGLSQKQLADAVGLPQSRISEWETAESLYNIRLSNAVRIAEVLECTVEDLISDRTKGLLP